MSIVSAPIWRNLAKKKLLAENEDINSEPVDAYELKENITDD